MSYWFEALGGATLRKDGEAVRGAVCQRHRIALLAYLTVRPQGASRETLTGLLWPDADSARARHSLSEALHVLRRTLGERAIVTSGDEIHLDPAVVRSDVAEFEGANRAGALARAAELYAGPFLAGFFLPSAPEFEQWAERERRRLERIHAEGLERLARRSEADGDPASAVHWWRQAAWHDPYSSRVALGYMEAMVALGDPAGAVQHAQIHAALLHDEIGAPADQRIAQLETRLRASSAPRSPEGAPVQGAARARPLPDPPSPTVAHEPVTTEAPEHGPGASAEPRVASVAAVGRPGQPWRKVAVLLGLAVVAALAGLALDRDVPRARSVAADAVVVFPFSVDGPPEVAYLSGGVATLLSAGMDGAGELRAVDAHLVMDRVRGGGALSPSEASVVAERLGATHFVLGRIVGAGSERLRLSGSLYRGPAPTERIAFAVVEGRLDELFELADRLSEQLLAEGSAPGTAAQGVRRVPRE